MEMNGMEMAWDGSGMGWKWHGMEVAWDGNGMEILFNGVEWNGMEMHGMEWNGMEMNGMGMGWNGNGMEWEWNGNGMEWKWYEVLCTSRSLLDICIVIFSTNITYIYMHMKYSDPLVYENLGIRNILDLQ